MLRDSIIVILAGMVAFVLLHDWVRTRFGPTPAELEAARRAQFAEPSPAALRAVDQFKQLPARERRDLEVYLEANLIPMATWTGQLGERTFQVLCLGEDHEPSTRDFLAREFFSSVSIDVLLLETTVDGLRRIDAAVAAGDARVALLEADIAAILRAARARNARIRVIGIEETKRQRLARQRLGQASFRDDTLARNFLGHFQHGQRHAVLFGALHCANQREWLFEQVRRGLSPRVAEDMLSVRILGDHQDQSVADFVYFLDQIGFPRRPFVIVRSRALHPTLVKWFWLFASTMQRYHTVIVFRD